MTEAFEQRLYSHSLHDSAQLEDIYNRYHAKLKVFIHSDSIKSLCES